MTRKNASRSSGDSKADHSVDYQLEQFLQWWLAAPVHETVLKVNNFESV